MYILLKNKCTCCWKIFDMFPLSDEIVDRKSDWLEQPVGVHEYQIDRIGLKHKNNKSFHDHYPFTMLSYSLSTNNEQEQGLIFS